MIHRPFLAAVRFVVLLVSLLVKPAVGQGGVTATTSTNATDLATLIFKPAESGIEITKAELKGDPEQHGVYSNLGPKFLNGLPSTGTVLSSGYVLDVKLGGVLPDTNFGGDGDSDLDGVLKAINADYSSKDAAVLFAEVKVSRPVAITVAYVFGSLDLVNGGPTTSFPDVFGLFVNKQNVALIGGKPVSAATIYCSNGGSSCDQLNNPNQNPNQVATSLIRYTTTQLVTLNLLKGTHQLKVAVADGTKSGTNRNADAGVFIAFVGAVKEPTQSPTLQPTHKPTTSPTLQPTHKPTKGPTMKPTRTPTRMPTRKPVQPSPPPIKGKMKMMRSEKMM
jgi:hypothetical protein